MVRCDLIWWINYLQVPVFNFSLVMLSVSGTLGSIFLIVCLIVVIVLQIRDPR